jgi:tRNA uridine 5-carbamoylmethylation protein Kti12
MTEPQQHLVVNMLGGPGGGKTTTAVSLYSALKKNDIESLLVGEFAQEKVIENNRTALSHQKYIWANQLYKIQCAYEKCPITISDSPVILGAIYNIDASDAFKQVVLEEHHAFNNFNIMIRRNLNYPHSMVSRIHTLEESITIDQEIIELLDSNNIKYIYNDELSEPDLVEVIRALIA